MGTVLYVLKSDGLYACGDNSAGNFGNGTSSGAAQLLIRVSTTLFPVEMYLPKGSVGGGMNLKLNTGEIYVSGSNTYTGGLGNTGNILTWTHSTVKDNSSTISTGGTTRSYMIKNNVLYGAGLYSTTYTYLLPGYNANVTTFSILETTGLN